jgi:hypothetical protein
VARVDGRRLSFEEEGIWNGVFVMRDRETGTLWSHYTGEAFEGPLQGRRLEWIQTRRAQYGRLLNEHPDATIPERGALKFRSTPPPKSRRAAMGEALPPAFVPTIAKEDDRLGRHEHGLGVFVGGHQRFYKLDDLHSRGLVRDTIGDVDVVVLIQDGGEAAAAYSACFNGESLVFEPAGHEGRLALKDQRGRTWLSTGEGVGKRAKGKRLTGVRSIVTDWYGWSAYFPKTTIYAAKK